jgi:hypothetical protein
MTSIKTRARAPIASVWFQLLLVALAASAPRAGAAADDAPPRCARCDGVIAEKLKVVVTDFAARREFVCCNMACAIAAMAEFATSRAVTHDPFAQKEVRIIRTGAKWVAWPTSSVFLFLPETESAKTSEQPPVKPAPDKAAGKQENQPPASTSAPKSILAPAERCLAFPRQVEYVQYLATHAEVAALKPRPLRLRELLAAVRKQDGEEKNKESPAQ